MNASNNSLLIWEEFITNFLEDRFITNFLEDRLGTFICTI